MTWSVYQPWDPLRVCVVGRSHPPEFYSWIKIPHVRELFEKIAIETEEDYQGVIKKLNEFGVQVLRPNQVSNSMSVDGRFRAPPMCPRDYFVMIGDRFYDNYKRLDFEYFYRSVKDSSWPECNTLEEFDKLPDHIQQECREIHGLDHFRSTIGSEYDHILELIKNQGNRIIRNFDPLVNGSMVSRIGKDLYFGTDAYDQDTTEIRKKLDTEFSDYRNHIVNTGGHVDGTYCPIAPGLIISLNDVPTYAESFPGWEVIYLPNQSWKAIQPFLDLKTKNNGKWWIPGWEHDQDVIDVVETWLNHWTGYVEETVFDVNMLMIDPKNIMVFNYNKQVFDALDRHGITPHIVPFRHRYFWDGGIHCITTDLHREGTQQDYFPQRNTR